MSRAAVPVPRGGKKVVDMDYRKIPLRSVRAGLAAAALLFCLLTPGCSYSRAAFPSDDAPAETGSAAQTHAEASEAMQVLVDGDRIRDLFVMKGNWYGEMYENENSLNMQMMAAYSNPDSDAPQAADGARVRLVFDAVEGMPAEIRLTQQGNTVRANTGLPFDVQEIEPEWPEEGGCAFTVSFGKMRMYYYLAECRWDNGNSASYAFALEKADA